MRRIVDSRWFALADLLFVLGGLAACMLEPGGSRWAILAGLIPWLVRAAAGRPPFRRTPLDWLIAIFLFTAWVGYQSAYNKTIAWDKAWWIVAAVLLYFAMAAQPRQNLTWICLLFFLGGVGISAHYLLTYDFAAAPRRLEWVNQVGRWLMEFRPQTGWRSIHPNYAGGLAAIFGAFLLYPLREAHKSGGGSAVILHVSALVGMTVIILTLFMTTSRGVGMAVAGGVGVWALWKFIVLWGSRRRSHFERFFPALVLIYLCVLTVLLYLGPASSGSVGENHHFGSGSRSELFSRSLYLIQDYAITGGGLGSFPGLYSRYILNIPYYNLPNSHNLFLDAAIEQGVFGGAALLLIYLAAIWRTVRSLSQEGEKTKVLAWIVMFALVTAVLHGMVDDYLYNGRGTLLALILPAFSLAAAPGRDGANSRPIWISRWTVGAALLALALVLLLNPRKTLSAWYANLGAVKMSQVDLEDFPGGGWVGPEAAERMGEAETALRASLELDPNNRTANQRLGMISMLRQDFEPGSSYLSAAYKEAPAHRGVLKSLGFCRAWLGDLSGARELLTRIPEAREELDAYTWWWGTQGRPDLSAAASLALQALK